MSEVSDLIQEYDGEDAMVAIQAACQMAERFGEDFAIMMDLSVTPLWAASEPPLEIIRCPQVFRKGKRPTISRVIK